MNLETRPLVSIVINNYNYESFLQLAIDSAINQTYDRVEIIVVDDGSRDRSREIISSYGDRIISVFKENGGQASALNAGVGASSGDIICFLDADDVFYDRKVDKIVELLSQLQWQDKDLLLNNFLDTIDREGSTVQLDLVTEILSGPGEWRFLPELTGEKLFFEGQLKLLSTPEKVYNFATKYRFIPYLGVQTSGITITKALANKVFPLPDKGAKISADVFLVKAASLFGEVYSTHESLTQYRIHQNNNWYGNKKRTEFEVQKGFFLDLNKFLNSKLEGSGRKAVFSYLESITAKGYYRSYFEYESYKHLFELAYKVIYWHVDWITVKFFVKTILLAMYFKGKCLIAAPKYRFK